MGRYLDLLVGAENAPQAEVRPRDKSDKGDRRVESQGLSSLMSLLSRADVQPDHHSAPAASDPSPLPAPAVATEATEAVRGKWSEAQEERAAIVECDERIPCAWAEGFARLHPDRPPAGVAPRRWLQFVDDIGRFLDSPFCAVAAALGWGPLDLFGCDREQPFAQIDHAGLLWLLNGDRLIDLNRHKAVIETRTGGQQTFRRRPVAIGDVVLAWERPR